MPFRTGHEGATVRMDPSGAVTVLAGVTSQGQGLETTMAQIAAAELGLPLDAVRVILGDTDATPFGLGAFASRQAVIGGGAVTRAARACARRSPPSPRICWRRPPRTWSWPTAAWRCAACRIAG